MHNKSLKHIVAGLPFEGKLVFFGAVILLISTFLPWYEDLDAFHMGDMFLGITGPLYLVGFVILLISGLSLAGIVSDTLDAKLKELSLEKAHMNILIGILSLFLLFLSTSVYFHTKFGVNITMKEMRFGMMLAFAGAGLITFGGFMQNKNKKVRFESLDGRIEPLISLSNERTPGEIKHTQHERTHVEEETKQTYL